MESGALQARERGERNVKCVSCPTCVQSSEEVGTIFLEMPSLDARRGGGIGRGSLPLSPDGDAACNPA